MDLKEMLGDAYKDGMTFDEISTALAGKKLADLSSGEYIKKDFSEAEKRRLEEEKRDLEKQLNDKLTDDEKAAKIAEEKDKEIQKLINQLKENTMNANKGTICTTTSDIRAKVGIGSEDTDFSKFVNLIAHEKSDDNTFISNYVNKLMNESYNKGAEDAKKALIADNNLQNGGGNADNNGNSGSNNENIGAKLAKRNKESNKTKYDYFA